MSLMTRAVAFFAALSAAAIPVAALTVKNTSTAEVKVAVDTGSTEAIYTIPAGGSIDVTEDCSADCAVTGPWGFSRLVAQNATIETDGRSIVTAEAAAPAPSLVPQNPIAEPEPAPAAEPAPSVAETAPAATAAPAAEPAVKAAPAPRKSTSKPRRKAKPAKKKGPAPGSFQLLLQGPGK